MRSGENPLDLNNLPDEYGRDGKQILEENSNSLTEASDATRCRKKKSGGKDECGKVYECRFCSLKFCKSQALGGHMNRHRQERETETLNRARQLVFSNDSTLAAQGGPHLGGMPSNMMDPSLPYRGAYPARLYSSSSPTVLSPIQPSPPQPAPPQGAYIYTPSSRFMSFPPSHNYPDYYVGHVLPPNTHRRGPGESSYTCIGAPLDQNGAVQGIDGATGEDGGVHNYAGAPQCYDQSSMNRFSD